ncbi:MAG: tRNA (adenosine(37)-N6)-dimethylallyltransferase MiaA [Phycisphaerales bacterium]|nr:tRNA (adenosine(37)-N6)-dimethylallyltransferase MiaA [Phycisphaerales bacterium]
MFQRVQLGIAMKDPSAILILGPTASGKSALALALCEARAGRCEIVTADSMQIYQGMDIGTAKPSIHERQSIPHHLIDITTPYSDGFTVDRWLERAHESIAAINAAQKCAIVVGGTNLYVQSLLAGLFDGPAADEALRIELRALPLAELRAQLAAVDAPSAQRIHPNDLRRMIRAIEVTRLTGIPMSTHQSQWSAAAPKLPMGWQCLGLLPDPESNGRSINRRAKLMMELGFLEEVRQLRAVAPLASQAAQAVGYRELAAHLDQHCSLDDAFEAIKIRTRKLARQQRTWLRRFAHIERSTWFTEPCGEKTSHNFFLQALGAR